MSTPMWDLPEHCPMPVLADGRGPAPDNLAHHVVCWCASPSCDLWRYEHAPTCDLAPALTRFTRCPHGCATTLRRDPIDTAQVDA